MQQFNSGHDDHDDKDDDNANNDDNGDKGKKKQGKASQEEKRNEQLEKIKEDLENIHKIMEKGEILKAEFQTGQYLISTTGAMILTTKNGTIKVAVSLEQYHAIIEGLEKLNHGVFGVGILLDVNQYANNEISGQRLTYKLTGETLAWLTPILVDAELGSSAGPLGTLVGIAVGLAFAGGEYIYDNREKIAAPVKQVVSELSNAESMLRVGRWP